ncbi:hypothetical protein CBW16_10810 [Flavobacteriaceae bacterium JJC]|uniref:hypothetical protein n=1 Tax=Kaistella soli TaxID=2849654 RepID=UPI000B4A57A5|nr:hypothetical protein [Kaistella soli]MBU8882473.1 hypothetical protein [Kaistella soli]OWK73233.1 hypothetical protein CBW16_10810 [Flavobacteriaceae bacterium JJC]
MKTIIYIAISSLILIGCNDLTLIKSDIKYSDLPREVKDKIFENEFYDLNEPAKFKIESSKTLLPWIHETELIRINDNKSYKIDFDKEYNSSTLVIFENYLYTTNNYNIYKSDSLYYTFSKYLIR